MPGGQTTAQPSTCERCRAVKNTKLCFFKENISSSFARSERTFTGNVCFGCMTKVFCEFTAKTLVGTWWGIIGALLGPAIIGGNIIEYLHNTFKFIKDR